MTEALLALVEIGKGGCQGTATGTLPRAQTGQLVLDGAFLPTLLGQTLAALGDGLASLQEAVGGGLSLLNPADLILKLGALRQQAAFVVPTAFSGQALHDHLGRRRYA
ncbi:hypothetical protein AB0M50_28225 [Nonomuraea fuscirosea]|uniref:hypothetical protein n=1 Tax=Nonomuraea fuscirosea TaxID=1291556 RepID=UPI003437B32B